MVLTLLEDNQLEVREQAGRVLTDLLHCKFIPDPSNLLVKLFCFVFVLILINFIFRLNTKIKPKLN